MDHALALKILRQLVVEAEGCPINDCDAVDCHGTTDTCPLQDLREQEEAT